MNDISRRLNGRRDSVVEALLARQLRSVRPLDAAQELCDFIENDRSFIDYQRHKVGLILCNRVLKDRGACVAVLRKGMDVADASTISFWLKYLTPRLGLRRIFGFFHRNLPAHAVKIQFAMYWFKQRQLAEIEALKLQMSFEALEKRLAERSAKGAASNGAK